MKGVKERGGEKKGVRKGEEKMKGVEERGSENGRCKGEGRRK